MNKQGIMSLHMIGWIIDLLFLVVVTVTIFMLINGLTKYEIDIFPLEADIFVNRLLYQANSFTYQEGGRVYPYIVDIEAFDSKPLTEKNLMDLVDYGNQQHEETGKPFNNHLAARIILETDYEEDGIPVVYTGELYYNELLFKKIAPIFKAKGLQVGKKGVVGVEKKFHINVKKGTTLLPGILIMEIVKPKSEVQYAIT